MGNIEAHDFEPVRPDERKELNLSRRPTYKQYLKHLEGEVHEACLRELPYSVRDSICLYEIMKLAFNAITELPPELPLRLPHLRYLDLSHNQLSALPCSFGLLFHLHTLLLTHNRLRTLPESFTRLVKLHTIDLSHNALRELPEAVGEMESLKRLNVSHNKLRLLPLSLGHAPHLRVLLCCHNRLDSPPQAICDEGSAGAIQFLHKQYLAHREQSPPPPSTPLNEFPRHRSNQVRSPVSNPQSAHMMYIQEQTHTTNTPSRIKTPLLPPLGSSAFHALELRDRVVGVVYGAALGDLLGLTTRWLSADQCDFHYGQGLDPSHTVLDAHRMPWRQGDWTSNFDVFMVVVSSLIKWAGVVDELDFAQRLSVWSSRGFPDLGDTTAVLTSSTLSQVVADPTFTSDPHHAARAVLERSGVTENGLLPQHSDVELGHSSKAELIESDDAYSAARVPYRVEEASSCSQFGTDNGAVIRAAALGIPSFHDLDEVEENSVRICRATHADPRCVASCVFVSLLVASMLQGRQEPGLTGSGVTEPEVCEELVKSAGQRAALYLPEDQHLKHFHQCLQIDTMARLKAREKDEMSHTFKPMAAAVLAVRSQANFKDFVSELAMEGGDSNSNCCVAGALMGLRTGYKHLPKVWLQALRPKQVTWLNHRINALLDMMGLP